MLAVDLPQLVHGGHTCTALAWLTALTTLVCKQKRDTRMLLRTPLEDEAGIGWTSASALLLIRGKRPAPQRMKRSLHNRERSGAGCTQSADTVDLRQLSQEGTPGKDTKRVACQEKWRYPEAVRDAHKTITHSPSHHHPRHLWHPGLTLHPTPLMTCSQLTLCSSEALCRSATQAGEGADGAQRERGSGLKRHLC